MSDVNTTQHMPTAAAGAFPPAAPVGPSPIRIPGAVRTASILAVVMAVITAVAATAIWIHRAEFVQVGLVEATAALNVLVAVGYLVGAVFALIGRTRVVLLIAAGAVVALSLISLLGNRSVTASAGFFVALYIVKLMFNDHTATFFAAHRSARESAAAGR